MTLCTSSDSPAGPALDAWLIDVRSATEFAREYLDGAIHLPLEELAQRLPALVPDRGQPLVLYCASGGRSAVACAVVRQLGYTQARNGGGLGLAALSTGRQVLRG